MLSEKTNLPATGSDQLIADLFAKCAEKAPGIMLCETVFRLSLRTSIEKYLSGAAAGAGHAKIEDFLNGIKIDDLYLALACAAGDEEAWRAFDANHRSFLVAAARHLANSETDAQDAVEKVYADLYGTRLARGARISKFAGYSGRGTLRGWLTVVIRHALVDLHRARRGAVSYDELTENVGESYLQFSSAASLLLPALPGENDLFDEVIDDRYLKATLSALAGAFESLDNTEMLIVLYYYVEKLTLREIAAIAAAEKSPLGGLRRPEAGRKVPRTRPAKLYESTIMRRLEGIYGKVWQAFRIHLSERLNLNDQAIEICRELATRDPASTYLNRIFSSLQTRLKGETNLAGGRFN